MEKYGVDESKDGGEKTAQESTPMTCPTCGTVCEQHGKVSLCPKCGSKPFEEDKKIKE